MVDLLESALIAASLVLALVVAAYVVRGRRPDDPLFYALTALEVGLVAQCVTGFVRLARTDVDVSGPTFIGYLLGSLVMLPVAFVWSVGEDSRGGTGVLLVALLVMPVLEVRLDQIWSAGV